jgi:protein TonB
MPPAPDRSRSRPADPVDLHLSPLAFWLGVVVIGLLTIGAFEAGYHLGKVRAAGRRSEPRTEAAADPKPRAKDPAAPAPKPPTESIPTPPQPVSATSREREPAPKPADPLPPPKVTFASDVRPVLQAKCASCHGGLSKKGGLDVRTLDAIARGGNEGPAVQPGSPEVSPLWTWVASGNMPPEGKPQLTAAEKKLIRDWIADGAR